MVWMLTSVKNGAEGEGPSFFPPFLHHAGSQQQCQVRSSSGCAGKAWQALQRLHDVGYVRKRR